MRVTMGHDGVMEIDSGPRRVFARLVCCRGAETGVEANLSLI